jgi:hypothetical protein
MGKIETDHTGSGGGITLSSDGTSLLLDGTAIGGGGGGSRPYMLITIRQVRNQQRQEQME